MLIRKARLGCYLHLWHLASSSLNIFWGEEGLGPRQKPPSTIIANPKLEGGTKEKHVKSVSSVAKVGRATAMEMCS